jgi:hypothetical protein
MIFIYGTRFYGKVRACGSSFIGTKFFHIWFMPLIPVGSHVVLEESGDGFRGIPTGLDGKSVLAGYLRVWGPLCVIGALFAAIGEFAAASADPLDLVIHLIVSAVTLGIPLAITVLAFAVIGKLSTEERRKRSVWALHTGYFLDPADMGEARAPLRESLMAKVVERARGLASTGYRLSADPVNAWPQVALDPSVHDDVLLTAAFTLTRIDASLAQGAWKAQAETLHDQLWKRIVQQNPPYLEAHAQAG